MASGKHGRLRVAVHGIGYREFARVKWSRFLRWASLIVALLCLCGIGLSLAGRLPEVPVSGALVAVLAVLAVLALVRTGIRKEYRASGLQNLELQYTFDRDGWSVKAGGQEVRVLWKNTARVQRTASALMLYPNRRSVNLLPLSALTGEELSRILRWVRGEK